MRTVTILLAALSALAAAEPALAHGGQYRGPGGRTPSDPTGPVAPPGSTADWEAWWAANAWKYVNLRERVRARDDGERSGSAGGFGVVSGPAVPVGGEAFDRRRFFEREVLPQVTALLRDGDAEVRSAATIALGKMAYPRSMLDLRRSFRDEVRDVRDGAVLATGMLGDSLALEDLQAILFDPARQDRTRSFAAIGIGFIGGPEAARILQAYLDPESDSLRVGGLQRTAHTEASALTALGLAGEASAAAVIRRDYASGTRYGPAVRSFAAVALARLGDREAIPFLLQGLDHAREPMRQSAAIALGVLGRPEDAAVVKALAAKYFEEKDINTRQFALVALARIGGGEAREAVRRALEKGPRIDRPMAALAVALGKDRDMAPALRAMFTEERSPDLKGGLALALALLEDSEAAPLIRPFALGKVDRGLRGWCLLALGLLQDRGAAPEVRKVVEEENDPGVRMAAATCLGLLQDASTVPLLEGLVREGDNVYVRSSACRLLGDIGSPLSARTLLAVVGDPKDNSVVRMAATAGLGNLGDRSLVPLLSSVGFDANHASIVDPLIEIAMIM